MKYLLTPLVAVAFLLAVTPIASAVGTTGQQVTNAEALLVAKKKTKKAKKAKKPSAKVAKK